MRASFKKRISIQDVENPSRIIALNLADYLFSKFLKQGSKFAKGETLASKLSIKPRELRKWLRGTGVRKIDKYFSKEDIAKILIDSLHEMDSRPDIEGNWLLWGSEYCLGDFDLFEGGTREVYIKQCPQLNAYPKWSVNVKDLGWVLGKDLEWIVEPLPQARDFAFVTMFRYDTKEEALATFIEFRDSCYKDPIAMVFNDYQ